MVKRTLIPNAAVFAALAMTLAVSGFSGAAFANASKTSKAGSLQAPSSSDATYAMNASVEVRRDTLYLSDFLLAGAPAWLRARAARVPLGDAPVPGAQRRIGRREIERDLRSFPDVRDALAIPSIVEVQRWSRPLGREEVRQAIEDALNEKHLSAQLARDNVDLNSVIYVTEASPQLKVTQIKLAPAGTGMRVRMEVSSEPRISPFWVLLDCEIEQLTPVASKDIPLGAPVLGSEVRMEMRPVSYGLGHAPETPADVVGRSTRRLIRAGETLRAEMLNPMILVRAGQLVEILLQGRGLRITAEATPLDAGMSGQKIRVRNQVTGKILTATVIGPRLVGIQF